MSDPTPEEIDRAARVVTRLSQDDRGKAWAIAVELARVRAESRKAALEEAATICESLRSGVTWGAGRGVGNVAWDNARGVCADAIRARGAP